MASYIERRKFLATLGGAAAAWPPRRARSSVIGFLRKLIYSNGIRTGREDKLGIVEVVVLACEVRGKP